VFGTVPKSNATVKPPTAAYALDAAPPFVTTEPTANSNIPSQPLFAAFQLSSEEHSLTITVENAQSPYILERFFVFPRVNVTHSAVDADPPPTPPKNSPPVTKAPTTTVESQMTVRVLAGVLGSLVALIVITGVFFLFRRWRLRTRKSSPMSETSDSLTTSSSRRLRGLLSLLRLPVASQVLTFWFTDTIFTSTESILRNNPPSMWSNYTRSEGGRGSVVDHYMPFFSSPPPLPPPLPPKT
jgi:hypothetical protein